MSCLHSSAAQIEHCPLQCPFCFQTIHSSVSAERVGLSWMSYCRAGDCSYACHGITQLVQSSRLFQCWLFSMWAVVCCAFWFRWLLLSILILDPRFNIIHLFSMFFLQLLRLELFERMSMMLKMIFWSANVLPVWVWKIFIESKWMWEPYMVVVLSTSVRIIFKPRWKYTWIVEVLRCLFMSCCQVAFLRKHDGGEKTVTDNKEM